MAITGTVADIMVTQLVTLWEEDNLEQIGEQMDKWRIRHLPVVDGRKLVGLISHRDMLRWAASDLDKSRVRESQQHRLREETFVADVMTRDVETVRPETPIAEAARRLVTAKFGCLPVVDAEGNLVGIVSEHDLLRLLVNEVLD